MPDVRFDWLDRPAFNIPVLGHAINFPAAITAYLAQRLSPGDEQTQRIAAEEGALRAWQQRQDVHPMLKMGAEMGALSVLPPFGRVGPAAKLIPGWERGSRKAIDATSEVLRHSPVTGYMMRLSPKGQLNAYSQDAGSAMNLLLEPRPGVAQLHPKEFLRLLEEQRKPGSLHESLRVDRHKHGLGQMDLDDIARSIQQAYGADLNKVKAIADKNPETIPFYGALADDMYKTRQRQLGAFEPRSKLERGWTKANRINRELLLSSGFTWVQNALDIGIKGHLDGISPRQLLADYMSIRRNPHTKIREKLRDDAIAPLPLLDDTARFQGNRRLHRSLEIDDAAITMGDVAGDAKKSHPLLLPNDPTERATLRKKLAGLGAAAGLMTGNPLVGSPLLAAAAPLMQTGLEFNLNMMRRMESAGRQRFMMRGAEKYFNAGKLDDLTFVPKEMRSKMRRDSLLADLRGELGDGEYDALFNKLRENKFANSTDDVHNILRQRASGSDRLSDDVITRATNIFRDLHNEAERAGIANSNRSNFAYTRDTNLVRHLRNVVPFPVWPVHNLPYYAQESLKNPMLGIALARYAQHASEGQGLAGLTQRFEQRVPISPVPGGELWANPMAPISISTQIKESNPANPYQSTSGMDQVQSWMETVGLGLTPLAQIAGQVAGFSDRGRDIQDIIPLTRLARAVGQRVTGQPFEPEGAVKYPFERIRDVVAPQSSPDIGYQDYLVRKKIAEMAIDTTGKGWWQSPEHSQAMIDPEHPLHSQAQRDVGTEQAILYASRRALPFGISYLPDAEKKIRGNRALLPEEFTDRRTFLNNLNDNPAFGYRWISSPTPTLYLKIMQDQYFRLPTEGREVFLNENKDFAQYIQWSEQQRKMGRRPTIDDYIKLQGR